jgi:hypothetical protein
MIKTPYALLSYLINALCSCFAVLFARAANFEEWAHRPEYSSLKTSPFVMRKHLYAVDTKYGYRLPDCVSCVNAEEGP